MQWILTFKVIFYIYIKDFPYYFFILLIVKELWILYYFNLHHHRYKSHQLACLGSWLKPHWKLVGIAKEEGGQKKPNKQKCANWGY